MTRTLAFVAVLLAGVVVLAIACSSGSSAQTPHAYTPLSSGFQTLGVPGSAGPGASPASTGCNVSSGSVQWPRESSSSVSPSGCGNGRPSTPPSTSQTPKSSPSATRRPKASIGTAVGIGEPVAAFRGVASWFCDPPVSGCTAGYPASGMFAAAGPRLRVGNWRGRYVEVAIGGRSVRVQLIDWCACGDHLIDLYSSVLTRLGLPLSKGVYLTTVTWGAP